MRYPGFDIKQSDKPTIPYRDMSKMREMVINAATAKKAKAAAPIKSTKAVVK